MVHERVLPTILPTRVRSRGAALHVAAAHGIGVNVASTGSTDESLPEDRQSPFAFLTAARSRTIILFSEDCDAVVAENNSSKRSEYVIREQDKIFHTLNDMKARFQETKHELRVVEIQKDALSKTSSVLQAKLRAARP